MATTTILAIHSRLNTVIKRMSLYVLMLQLSISASLSYNNIIIYC